MIGTVPTLALVIPPLLCIFIAGGWAIWKVDQKWITPLARRLAVRHTARQHDCLCKTQGCQHPARWLFDPTLPDEMCECHSWNLTYKQMAGATTCHRDYPKDFK